MEAQEILISLLPPMEYGLLRRRKTVRQKRGCDALKWIVGEQIGIRKSLPVFFSETLPVFRIPGGSVDEIRYERDFLLNEKLHQGRRFGVVHVRVQIEFVRPL